MQQPKCSTASVRLTHAPHHNHRPVRSSPRNSVSERCPPNHKWRTAAERFASRNHARMRHRESICAHPPLTPTHPRTHRHPHRSTRTRTNTYAHTHAHPRTSGECSCREVPGPDADVRRAVARPIASGVRVRLHSDPTLVCRDRQACPRASRARGRSSALGCESDVEF
jgi:hypothetical protein